MLSHIASPLGVLAERTNINSEAGHSHLIVMAELLRSISAAEQELVDAARKVVGFLELVLHTVSSNFAPDVGLAPENPGTAHFIGISVDVG